MKTITLTGQRIAAEIKADVRKAFPEIDFSWETVKKGKIIFFDWTGGPKRPQIRKIICAYLKRTFMPADYLENGCKYGDMRDSIKRIILNRISVKKGQ
jgi:hypothetical protein